MYRPGTNSSDERAQGGEDSQMKSEDLKWQDHENGLVCRGTDLREAKSEPSEIVLLACVYFGSIGGAIVGCYLAKLYLGGIFPVAFGMLGCMIGTMMSCLTAFYFTTHYYSGRHVRTIKRESGS
jgi:hypothetical protein